MSIRLGGTIPLEQCRQYMSPKNDPHHWKYICIEGTEKLCYFYTMVNVLIVFSF